MKKLEGRRILVVDDEALLREMIAEELAANGASVATAENGAVAFDLIKQSPFDAVISDMRMPGGDGTSLFRNIKLNLERQPKLFLCSGFNQHAESDIQDLGVIKVFRKPFEWAEIIDSISDAIGPKTESAA